MEKEPITYQGLEKLKKELEELKNIKRPKIIEAIAEARAHGDLKENAEYHAAKEVIELADLVTEMKEIKHPYKQVKGKETVIVEKKNKICQDKIDVFESHRYEISQLGNQLHCLGSSKSCKYEVIKHNEHNIFGTQFHPEMSSDGLSIIQAFLSL